MQKTKTSLVVMAAGMGSRYGGIKQLDAVGLSGETILEFGLYDAIQAGFDEVVFIIRRDIEADFRNLVLNRIPSSIPVKVVFQDGASLPSPFRKSHPNPARTKPWGTAHAVWCARGAVSNNFAVINADDFYGRQSYALLHEFLVAADPHRNAWALAGYQLRNTLSENGAVSRGICRTDSRAKLTSIEEHTQLVGVSASEVESLLPDGTKVVFSPDTTVSMNMFGFTCNVFDELEFRLRSFLEQKGSDLKAECYLPVVVGAAVADRTAEVTVLDSPESWFGVTFQADREPVCQRIRALVSQGNYPRNLWGQS